jgi:hypothetical protein
VDAAGSAVACELVSSSPVFFATQPRVEGRSCLPSTDRSCVSGWCQAREGASCQPKIGPSHHCWTVVSPDSHTPHRPVTTAARVVPGTSACRCC